MAVSVVLVLSRVVAWPHLPAYASLAVDVGLCFMTTLVAAALTKPADMEVLVKFYSRVRPWGVWGPVRREAVRRGWSRPMTRCRPWTRSAVFPGKIPDNAAGRL